MWLSPYSIFTTKALQTRFLYVDTWTIFSYRQLYDGEDRSRRHQVCCAPHLWDPNINNTRFRSFTGVILVSLSDSGGTPPAPLAPAPTSSLSPLRNGHLSLLGDSLALLSALFYAFYVILLKVRIRSESRIDMQLFFGFVGLFNISACWPIGVILHFTGVERFELPASGRAVAGLLVNVSLPNFSIYRHRGAKCRLGRWLSHYRATTSTCSQC